MNNIQPIRHKKTQMYVVFDFIIYIIHVMHTSEMDIPPLHKHRSIIDFKNPSVSMPADNSKLCTINIIEY